MADTNEDKTTLVDYLQLSEDAIKSKSDTQLMHDAVAALQDSYSHRANPVHKSHKNVDEIRNEMRRRDKERLFTTAWNEFDRRTERDPEDDV